MAEKVKKALQHQLKTVFTPTVLDKIHFGSSAVLNPGVLVRIESIYRANPSARERVTYFYVLEEANAEHQVYDALKNFSRTNPIKIPYQSSKAKASDPAITKLIRNQLKSNNPTIFTSEVIAKITFSSTILQPNTPVQVQATYNKKATSIYVKEAKKAKDPDQVIYDALKKFNYKNPIVIPYNKTNPTAKASDPAITKLIRNQLKPNNPTIFTSEVIAKITFSSTILQPNTPVQVQATYNKKATSIYIKEQNEPEIQKVINDLQTLNTPATAVEIPTEYGGKYADEHRDLLHPKAGDAIRIEILQKKLPSISAVEILPKISFSHVQLKQGVLNTVTATYRGASTNILVKLKELPIVEVRKVLKKFSSKTHRLKLQHTQAECDAGKGMIFANEPLGSQKIRNSLVQQGGLSQDLADRVNFTENCIALNVKDKKIPDPGRL